MAEPGTEWVEDLPLAPGDIIAGKYKVEGLLGRGGMGIVVAARHLQVNHRVALKVLLPGIDGGSRGQAAARFLREAQNATLVQSEHVVRVTDMGTLDGGVPYLVMEYLDGVDLARVLRTRGSLPVQEAVGYVLQALVAIAEAHARGIIHRDLKPSNLFLCERIDGSPLVKVLDFGVSKAATTDANALSLTDTSVVIGSPQYMSPEQIRTPRDTDRRSDIWSLGVILQELITGQPPFTAQSVSALLVTIVTDPPIPLSSVRVDVPAGMDAVITRCLAKDPKQRFGDVAELADALLPFCRPEDRGLVRRVVVTTQRKNPSAAPVPQATPPVSPGPQTMPVSPDGPTASEPFELGTGLQKPPAAESKRRSGWAWGLGGLGVAAAIAVLIGIVNASRERASALPPASSAEALRPPLLELPAAPSPGAMPAADEPPPSSAPAPARDAVPSRDPTSGREAQAPASGESKRAARAERRSNSAKPTRTSSKPRKPAAMTRKPEETRTREDTTEPAERRPAPPAREPTRPAAPPDMSDLIDERR